MSEAHATSATTVERNDWDAVLSQLRADGFSPVESIKVTRAALHVSLGQAKVIVHQSLAWADLHSSFEALHETVEAAATRL